MKKYIEDFLISLFFFLIRKNEITVEMQLPLTDTVLHGIQMKINRLHGECMASDVAKCFC